MDQSLKRLVTILSTTSADLQISVFKSQAPPDALRHQSYDASIGQGPALQVLDERYREFCRDKGPILQKAPYLGDAWDLNTDICKTTDVVDNIVTNRFKL